MTYDEPVIPVAQPTAHLDGYQPTVYVDMRPYREIVNGEFVHGGLAYDPDMPLKDFLEWLERDARAAAFLLENSFEPLLPQGFTEYWYPPTAREIESARRIERAMMLATDAETFVALADGKAVHRSRLRKDVLDTLERGRRHQRV